MKATKTPGQVLRRSLPGRMQVQLNYYDRERRVHRPVPGHALTFDVQSPAEARALFAELKAIVDAGAWRDAGLPDGDSADAGAGVAAGARG